MISTTELLNDQTGGALTAPPDNDCPNYNVALVLEYCEKTGRDISDLTDEELKPFIMPNKHQKIA